MTSAYGLRAIMLAGALLPGAAAALSVDGRSQIHAVIGQPLAVAVPVSFAGVNPSTVTVRVVPSPDLPDEEEMVATSVQAAYDPERSVVRLSTPRRLTVPALGLHLVVSAGTLVVNQDIDVLVDVPDLDAQHSARGDAAPAAADAEMQGTAIRVLTVEKPATAGRQFGDAAAIGAAADAERPNATPPPPPPPPDPRPRTWQVRQGETLDSISHALAAAYHVPVEAMALALYEGNSEAFAAKAPEQALAGRRLQVPEDFVVKAEPASRVAAFRAWLQQPLQPWKLRSFPSLQADAAPLQDSSEPAWQLAQSLAVVAGAALLLLASAIPLRRLRLRRLMTRYVPMSAVQVKKVRRIIIPAPPPRRGLSQGAVSEKLRIKRLREMLDHNPFRSDIRYRLAERLHKAGDGRTFGQIAPPLRPSLSPEAWARICKMGQELLPGDPRFQGQG